MSEALSNIGQFLGSNTGKGLLTGGVAGGGLIQNWLAERQANQKQKFVQDLITNPEKFNALVARTEQPLSKGLTTDVARQVDAWGAERGLGSSPAVMREAMAQALGPLDQQRQQMAINSLLSRLQTYAGQPTMPGVNVAPMLQALSMWKPNQAQPGANLWVDPGVNVMQPSYMPGGSPPVDIPSITNIPGAFTPQVDISGPGFSDIPGQI